MSNDDDSDSDDGDEEQFLSETDDENPGEYFHPNMQIGFNDDSNLDGMDKP